MSKRIHQAVGIVAAIIALSGCGTSAAEEAKPPSTPSSPTARPAEAGTETTGDEVDARLTGIWGNTSASLRNPDTLLVLVIKKDEQVELRGMHFCRGKVAKEDGMHVIRLTCEDGYTDRTVGRVYGLAKDTMTVDWEGYGADSLSREP
ncbi:hypothetical protein ACFY93_29655 [Streptomyces sp. NPDC008313]|uniref:hypothetical protein n=1 Tax=Streptomyces sp. NPDC008313 TaxID=3364826 RepID=UPI0036E40CE2